MTRRTKTAPKLKKDNPFSSSSTIPFQMPSFTSTPSTASTASTSPVHPNLSSILNNINKNSTIQTNELLTECSSLSSPLTVVSDCSTISSKSSKTSSKKRIQIGNDGDTPKRTLIFDKSEPTIKLSETLYEMSLSQLEALLPPPPSLPQSTSSVGSNSDTISTSSFSPLVDSALKKSKIKRNINATSSSSSSSILTNSNIYSSPSSSSATASASRPKTGRGKSRPSPDEFFDYVVPSPDHGEIKSSRLVLHNESRNSNILPPTPPPQEDESPKISQTNNKSTISIDTILESAASVAAKAAGANLNRNTNKNGDNNNRNEEINEDNDNIFAGIDLEGIPRERQLALVACWLVGSAIRI